MMTLGGRRGLCVARWTTSTRIPEWDCWRPGSSWDPRTSWIRSAKACATLRLAGIRIFPARRFSGFWPVQRWSAGRHFTRSEGSTRSSDFPVRRSASPLDLAAAGWGLVYVDDIVVHHHPSSNREGSAQRRVSIVRSRLLTAVLRRSWSFVLRDSVRQLRSGRDGRAGLTAAVARLRPALRARQRTSRLVEGELNRLRRDAQATDGSFTAPRTGYEAG